MAPSQPFTVIIRVSLPAWLPPEAVVSALHAHEPLIGANPYTVSYERRYFRPEEVAGDTLFHRDGPELSAFVVRDRIPIIPGAGSWASKGIEIPCVFQSFTRGVRCRADSQGVRVRSSYEVRLRGEVWGGTLAGPGEGNYELVEIANIECGSIIRPFVRRSFSSAHQEILQRVVDEVARSSQPQASISPGEDMGNRVIVAQE
ncbi:hypothetical protein B0T24DRAFT_116973 [Lasiosphaeria ovina]|uniref:DUF7053 domain-containing protein n=1 Tax=Lasiosphaeria ovina TaxID=92902 RepID=A0AAE0JTH9_9PEZI|nr:hypothetical protein B0T24DRAFT_116973 [Lasiosphaeria ovina]